jgi:hypothetical protein
VPGDGGKSMKDQNRFVYVGPEKLFRGLRGSLVEAVDPATHTLRFHFQPESAGIMALPCEATDVQATEAAG